MIAGNVFVEIAAILGLATLTGIIGQKLRQPLIIMLLATGILVGPSFLGIIHSYEQIELLAHIGIALLLFIVGLKLDLNLRSPSSRSWRASRPENLEGFIRSQVYEPNYRSYV